MKIEKYSLKSYDINRGFIFYSKNDLLIPYLKLLVRDFQTNNGLRFSFSEFKKGVVMTVNASISIPSHEKLIRNFEKLLQETFSDQIKEIHNLTKLSKILK